MARDRRASPRLSWPVRLLVALTALLICRVTLAIVLGYRNYFPPRFDVEFLRGREPYFWGSYAWAFYAHIASGPVSLLLGLALMSRGLRARWPAWHRRLGRLQVGCVLLLVAPSGLWMAWRAAAGRVAGVSLGTLAIATGICVAFGWRAAVRRKFVEHRRWMSRTFVLLCSAVVLRVLGGAATVLGMGAAWVDPAATWLSWLGPLAAYETWRRMRASCSDREPDCRRSRWTAGP